jgi:phage-related protein
MQSLSPENPSWRVIAYDARKWEDFLQAFASADRLYIESFISRVVKEYGSEMQRSSDVKYLRNRISEFRIRRNPNLLVRVMFRTQPGRTIYVVGFYDKKKHPANSYQQDQIKQAEKR